MSVGRAVESSPSSSSSPLSEPVLLILMSLAAEPRHGYGILKDVEAMTEERVRLSTGTLFGALNRMLRERWIRRVKAEDTTRDKQYYELTQAGVAVLEAEVARMKLLARRAASRMAARQA